MTFNFLIIIFILFNLLFLVVSFLTTKKYLPYVVILNFIFYNMNYIITNDLLGEPKPIIKNMPGYDATSWPKNGLKLKYISNDINDPNLVYLILQNQENSKLKFYFVTLEPTVLQQIKDALLKSKDTGEDVILSPNGQGFYGDVDTSTTNPIRMLSSKDLPPKVPYGASEEEHHAN